jgi:hypothetical protein
MLMLMLLQSLYNRSPGRTSAASNSGALQRDDGSWQLTNFFEALSPRNAGSVHDANKSMLTHDSSNVQQQYATGTATRGGLLIAAAVTKKPTPNRETIMASFTSKLYCILLLLKHSTHCCDRRICAGHLC